MESIKYAWYTDHIHIKEKKIDEMKKKYSETYAEYCSKIYLQS